MIEFTIEAVLQFVFLYLAKNPNKRMRNKMTQVQIIDLIPERETSVAPILKELEQSGFPLENVKEQLLHLNSIGKIELIKRRILGRTRAQLNDITIPDGNINYTHVRRCS